MVMMVVDLYVIKLVAYHGCPQSDVAPQLLTHGLFPGSGIRPETVFTFDFLELCNVFQLDGVMTMHTFVRSCNEFRKRYTHLDTEFGVSMETLKKSLQRTIRRYRSLREGLELDTKGFSCFPLCPACTSTGTAICVD